jgi:hypothetical protein
MKERLSERFREILNEQDFCFDLHEMNDVQRALIRLAAYEDTGLTPEEVDDLQDKCFRLDGIIAEYKDAESDGRLIVLPCRIGDQVWTIRNHGGVPHVYTGAVSEIFFAEDDAGVTRLCMAVKGVSKGFWGERFFNTREEAEAALKEAHNGE